MTTQTAPRREGSLDWDDRPIIRNQHVAPEYTTRPAPHEVLEQCCSGCRRGTRALGWFPCGRNRVCGCHEGVA